MRTQNHTFIFDRMSGQYRDTGPSTTLDRVLSFFSAGQVRIAPVAEQDAKPAKPAQGVDNFPSGFDR
jgi:hypothetical protein